MMCSTVAVRVCLDAGADEADLTGTLPPPGAEPVIGPGQDA